MNKKKERKDRRKVKAWMAMQALRPVDIQRALGHKHHSPVVETLSGAIDNREVLAWLRDNGCPIKDLHLPKDMTKDN